MLKTSQYLPPQLELGIFLTNSLCKIEVTKFNLNQKGERTKALNLVDYEKLKCVSVPDHGSGLNQGCAGLNQGSAAQNLNWGSSC